MSAKTQRGSALVETALIIPLVIGVTLLAADMYALHQARSYLEQSAHNVASVLGAQTRLDSNGLRALIEFGAPPHILKNYEMIISKVENDRSMNWRPLYRGNVEGLCPRLSDGQRYNGELPESEPEPQPDEEGAISTSMVVVQLCRSSEDLALSNALTGGETLVVAAVSRLQYGAPALDDVLTREVQPEEEEETP